MNINPTSAAGFLLQELTWKVRVVTTTQVERVLSSRFEETPSPRSVLQRLRSDGLIRCWRTAVALHEADRAIACRSGGGPPPDFGALAWLLEKRWRDAATGRATIYWASDRAARLLGGVTKFDRRAGQLEHDLGTASVLVRLHETRPELADHWRGEDVLRRDFAPGCAVLKKMPDAAIVAGQRIVRVIEYGGQYPADRLRRFDAHFYGKHNIPYEIW